MGYLDRAAGRCQRHAEWHHPVLPRSVQRRLLSRDRLRRKRIHRGHPPRRREDRRRQLVGLAQSGGQGDAAERGVQLDHRAVVLGAMASAGGAQVELVRGGMDYSEIAKIPAKFFKGIELDDADEKIVGTLFEDTRFSRRLCGQGSFDIPRFLKEAKAAGFDAPYYGVEIISESFRKQSLDVMARTSFETAMDQVQKAFN